MYENEERITETEVVDCLRALLYGESIEDTLLDGSHTETFRDGGWSSGRASRPDGADESASSASGTAHAPKPVRR